MHEAAEVLRSVAEAAPTAGRALGAANAALAWPDGPLGTLWQAATVLRELRGDGHVLAQLAVGLDGLSTMVLRAGHDLSREALQPNRGWTDEEWEAAAESLASRNLLDREGRATLVGKELLGRAESLTDDLALEPWTRAGAGTAERFAALAAPLTAAARTVHAGREPDRPARRLSAPYVSPSEPGNTSLLDGRPDGLGCGHVPGGECACPSRSVSS